ncbi:hypothetical protein [Marivita sp. XM-24bin2]|jgi:hypothetical protein|uniref:hypothetical protein n=1 Tax=Marivita sp. XM-24bin2 TaxID=2133951 RepID=UPI000D7ACA2C|nr:hypothetical protein [Marivita sp. XM-24bin2]MCR9111155.1 hypothetical protein [Paracoccaceae bacterium]PWL32751.1 MAG: hypothetical protein DCO97_20955 [Marivita sp. XM-24bin2]
MHTFFNAIARVLAYGAIPALIYLIAVVAIGGGGEPAILFPIFYIWVIVGVLIRGWVERRKAERNK